MPWWPWRVAGACLVSGLFLVSGNFSSAQTLAQQAYLKASTAVAGDNFGRALAISGDTAVVGAPYEDTGLANSGAVYVFVRNGANWTQQAQLKSSQQGNADNFGFSVAISGDTIVVGALNEDSSTTGVNSTPNESATNAGAAYVFVRSGTNWIQQAYLKASNAGAGDNFGDTVAISTNTIVVGAPFEDSDATTINGSSGNNNKADAGAAYVFVRSGSSWSQQAYLKASNSGSGDVFGDEVAVSGDTIVVGAFGEDSSSTGVNSSANESASSAGAAYVFVRNGTNWSQQAYLKASNTGAGDDFGSSLAIEDQTIVVGAPWEDSSSTGINAIANESASNAGAAYVFVRSGTSWSQQAYLKASNVGADDEFGDEVAISGNTVVVGALGEGSSTTGVNSSGNESATFSGAAYVFARSGSSWTQQAYLKASNTEAYDVFGDGVAIFGDTVVVGASEEESNGSSQTNNDATGAGAAYVFTGFGAGDPDGDGLTDAQEVILGTNPNFADTDGDGLNDNVEANTPGLDPLLSEMPGTLVAKQSGANGFVATWGPVAGAAGYEVQVSTEPSFTSGLIGGDRAVSGSTTASLAITGMTNQIRYYRVRTVIPSSGGPVRTGWSPAVSAPDLSGFGHYLALNGGTTNANSLPIASTGLPDNGSYTITFWMRPDRIGGVSGTENVQVFRQQINTDTNTANVDLDLMPDGSLVFGQKDPTMVERKVQTASKMILTSNWYHVALVRDATNTELRFYLNGVGLVTNNSAFGTNSWGISVAGGPAAVQAALNNDANTNRMKGAFDDVRVYRTVRTQSQILEDMSGPLTRAHATNATNSALVFYAPLEGTAVTTADTNTIFKGTLNGSGSGTFITQSTLTPPVLSWSPDPVATLATPATLANSVLTATAKTAAGAPIPGSWTYTPAAGSSLPVGTNQIVGTFVPQDLDTYSVATFTNRVVVTDPDTDEDGFTDGEEMAAGTDPNSASSFLTNGVTGRVLGWGWVSSGDPLRIPESLRSGVDQVVASPNESFAVALQGGVPTVWALDSTATNLVATKLNGPDRPTNGVLQVAAGWGHVIALKENGSVVVWGDDTAGEGVISGAPQSSDTNYIAVASGDDHCLALKKDGTVVAWGRSVDSDGTTATGQLNFAGVTNVVGIAAGLYHSLALKSDGTLVGKGRANYGAANVDPGLTGVVAVAAGRDHSLVLLANGNLEAWGRNSSGQSDVPDGTANGNFVLTNVSAMPAARFAAGRYYSIAVREDGKVLEWGQYRSDSTNYVDVENQTPGWLTNVVGVTAGRYYSLVIRSDAKAPRLDLPANLVRLTPGSSTNLTLKSAVSSQTFSQVGLPAGITLSSNGLLAVGNSVAPTNVFARIMVANTNGSDARVVQLQVLSGDTNPPVITLAGNSLVLLESGDPYTDVGATVTDDVDSPIVPTAELTGTGIQYATPYSDTSGITDSVGTYTITYRATDAAGNQATPVTRTVKVFPNGYLAWANGYGLFGANVPDLDADGDSDEADNLAEFTAGTDPNKGDTDGDGYYDDSDVYPLTANHNLDVYLGLLQISRQDSANAPVPAYPAGQTNGVVLQKVISASAPLGMGISKVEVTRGSDLVVLDQTNPAGPGRVDFGPAAVDSLQVVASLQNNWEDSVLRHGNYNFLALDSTNGTVTDPSVGWDHGSASIKDYPNLTPVLTGTNWFNGELCLPHATNGVLAWSNNWTNHLDYGMLRVEIEKRGNATAYWKFQTNLAVSSTNFPTQLDLGALGILQTNTHYTTKLIFAIWKDGALRGKETRFHLVTGPQVPPSAPTLASLVASNGINKLGPVVSTDSDAGDSVALSLPGGSYDNSLFDLVGSDLQLKTGNFDRASKTSYRVLVRATDSHGLFAESIFNLTVPKKAQSILFGSLAAKTYGDTNFPVGATASSGLSIAYESSNPGVAIVVGGEIQILGAGTTDITASQPGDDVYEAAAPADQTLTVNSAGTVISSGSGVGVTGGISSASTSSAAPIVNLPGSMIYNEKIPLPGAVQVSRVGESGLNMAIPDGNPGGMSRQLTLSGLNLSDYRLTVGLNIQGIDFGASLGDYYVSLRHSGNGITEQTRVLLNRVGLATDPFGVGSLADGINAIFADTADTNIQNATDPLTGPLLGTFQPTSLLSGSSNGLGTMGSADWNGTWTLFVEDQQSGGSGNLVDWFMQFEDMSSGSPTADTSSGLEYEISANGTDWTTGSNSKGELTGNELKALSGSGTIYVRARYRAPPAGGNASEWSGVRTVTLQKANQTIIFPVLGTRSLAPSFPANASTDSGLNLSYSSSDTNVVTVDANGLITPVGTGSATITAAQGGNENYSAAISASQGVTIVSTPLTPYFGASQLYWQEGTNPAVLGSRTGHLYEPIRYAEASGAAGIVNVQIVGAAAFDLSATSQPSVGVTGYSEIVSPGMNSGFTRWFDLTNSMKSGSYEFQGKNNSAALVTNATLTWSNSSNFPTAVPKLGGPWVSKALRLADPTTAGTISWDLWSNRPSNSMIRMELEPEGYASGGQLASFLPADTNQFTIPAGSLATNRIYNLKLSFGVRESDGGTHANQTQVRLATGPNYPPSAPVLANAVAGVIGVREGTNLVGTLELPTDQDSGDSITPTLPALSGNGAALDNFLFELAPNGLDASRVDLRLRSGNFDYTEKSQYQILVRHTDGFGLYADTAYTVSVSRDQTITFNALTNKTYGDAAFDLEATSDSGLPVSYSSSNPNVAEVTGNRVTIKAAGSVTITATQAGGVDGWLAAEPVEQGLVVSPKSLTIGSPAIAPRDFNGTKTAGAVTVGSPSGFVGLETVTVTASAADYPSADAATYSSVVVTYTLQDGTNGGKASNYRLADGSATGEITRKGLGIGQPTITKSKEYNGNRTAGVSPGSLTGLISADVSNVSVSATAEYDTAAVGTGKTITVVYSLSGSAAGNYTVPGNEQVTDGEITRKGLTGSFTASNKEYDGSDTATVTSRSVSGQVGGDDVSLSGGTAKFSDASAGNGKTVTLTGATLAGTAAGNYTLGSVATTTANITKATPTISQAPVASQINQGQALSAANLTGGAATGVGGASVDGSFAFTSPNDTPPLGTANQQVTFTPSDSNYTTATTTVSVTVIDLDQPIAGTDNVTAAPIAGNVVKYAVAQLLLNDEPSADPADTRALSISNVSSNSFSGSIVSRKGGWIIYQPSAAAISAGNDSFTYTLSNGVKTATGTVTVDLSTMPDFTLRIAIESMADRTPPLTGKTVTFAVSPNKTFEVQATSDLANWTTIDATATSFSDGRLVVDDQDAGSVRFYRVRWIP